MRLHDHILEITRLIIMKIRVRMKRRSELDLTTRDSYFKILVQVFTNHILAKNIFYESYRVNRTQDYSLKPGSKY